tara:strand:+ start:186 stop:698 length:513 start_codon:yes stop_codon:yes gene_type:complete
MGRSSDAHIEMLENMSDEERQEYEKQELMSDPEVQLSMMINERRKKGMVVHNHEMWVDVESDKKDAMSESAFKAFKNRIKKLKVKDFVKCGIYQPFSPDEPTEWIWIEITSILENGLYMGIASNEPCYESNIQLHDRCSLKARSINDVMTFEEYEEILKAHFKKNLGVGK